MKTILMMFAMWCLVSTVEAKTFLYISLGGDNQITCFESNSQTGELTHIEKISTHGAPGAMAVDATNTYLFVSLRTTQGIGTYKIDAKTGRLTQIATQTVGVNPVYLSMNPSSSQIFLASYSEGKVATFPLSEEGKLDVEQGQWFDTDINAHAFLLDPSGRFGLVPHTGPNAMYQFVWDEKSAKLSFNAEKKVIAPEGAGPRNLAYHPNGKFVYTSDELGSSSSVYLLNPQTGRLTHRQTVSTLPPGFERRNTCADVEISPSAKYLYVSNRGHDSIAIFSIDPTNSNLEVVGHAPTERVPRSFNLTPDGKFLYAAGQKSGNLISYRVEQSDGTLTRLHLLEVGNSPSWVQTVSTQ